MVNKSIPYGIFLPEGSKRSNLLDFLIRYIIYSDSTQKDLARPHIEQLLWYLSPITT